MDEFLKSLKINKEGYYKDKNTYVVDFDDSDEYGKIYNLLEKSELDKDSEVSDMTDEHIHLVYENEYFILTLIADWEEDVYKIECKRR